MWSRDPHILIMIYFLYGPDKYRARQKLNHIIKEYKKNHQSGLSFIIIDLDSENNSFDKEKLEDIKKTGNTVSMFDQKKLIVLKNSFSQSEKFQQEFLDYLKQKKAAEDKDLSIVLLEEKIDKKSKLFKFLKQKSNNQCFDLLKNHQVVKWIKGHLKKKKLDIENPALDLLIKYIGNDLWKMENELNKLISFAQKDQNKIQIEDIKKLIKPKIDLNIFNTIDALASRNKKTALKLLNHHLQEGESPGYLLNRFVYQFRNLIKVKSFLNNNYPGNYYSMASKLNMHPFVAKKSISQARNFTFDDLKKIYNKLLAIDLDIKTGNINSKTALEIFIFDL